MIVTRTDYAPLEGHVYQHVVTSGGETYTKHLGMFDEFNVDGYLSDVTNVPWGDLIEVEDNVYVNFSVITKLWFSSIEAH